MPLVPLLASVQAETWIETSQSDFGDGSYHSNIYASHRNGGAVEFEPRFDLNNDGYCDLLCADGPGPYLH
ncbi:hypothetical protein CH330_07205 [candidate division WOR-3 bacterium JGI_Cruoil_03_51_56]|uniref:VCBS repeat-containing protein n=1 Tax=candidate division WOR-3 bacterium JGI_Cruoil_03_51_56 TaxID=1973747 RepID=A0A235BRT1_UNCW3|nr:MAG: hypothetical protein CH330_07205 [candidate division WOR-3 bacterium JGI_Cruoil_03_51_56]